MGSDGAAGVPLGSCRDAVEGMGLYINRAPIRDNRATCRAAAGDYMLRAALVVTHFILAKNRHATIMIFLLVL